MRLRFLVHMQLQSKFLFLILVSMIVPLVVIGGCLYYLIFTLVAEQLGIPESIAYNLFPVIKKINLILMVSLPPLALILLAWGVFLSHTFIGPLMRLEKEIDRMASGAGHAKSLRVRRQDAIKPLADAINRLLDSMGKRR